MKKKTDSKPTGEKKEKPERTPRGKYDEKLSVQGSFLDIIGAVVKDANRKPKDKGD